jgi:hypothetical protein
MGVKSTGQADSESGAFKVVAESVPRSRARMIWRVLESGLGLCCTTLTVEEPLITLEKHLIAECVSILG